MHRSHGILLLAGIMVASCATTPSPSPEPSVVSQPSSPSTTSAAPSTSPTPVSTSIPFPEATPSAAADGWPYVALDWGAPVIGSDGTAYLLAVGGDPQDGYISRLVALDAGGHVKPDWAIEASPGSYLGTPAVGPDGSVYIGECGAPEVGCVLHRLDAEGRELPGWPFEIPSAFACEAGGPSCGFGVDIGSDGGVYLDTHYRQTGGLDLIAVDPVGKMKPGWPVALEDHDGWWDHQQLSPDGTVFILWRPVGSPTIDEFSRMTDNAVELWAFAPDGSPRPGWPVSMPDIGRYLLGPQGTVVVWSLVDRVGDLCPTPRRTVFTVLGSDGRTLPGWPRGSKGWASEPVVDAEGTVYYVTAQGNVYAHDRAGEIKAGWPAAVPGAFSGCGTTGPYLAPDGTIYVLGNEVTARSPDGRSRPGWPYRPAGQLYGPCLDSECYGPHPVEPAFGLDGTIYLVVFHTDPAGVRAEVVALDRQGQLKPGWPYRLPFDPSIAGVGPLTMSPDGRLFVSSQNWHLSLDPDGRLSD